MRVTKLLVPMLLLAAWGNAQVLTPDEIRDPNLSELQRKYFGELKRIAIDIANRDLPYHFYFSRKLDLSEKEQHASDQRSIQFDRYRDQTVLKITGNYFAAYSTELMQPAERARQTYHDVMLPLLEAAVPLFATANVPDAFAFEISHHVRKKVLGVSSEGVENVVLILPKASAVRYMTAANQDQKEAALFGAEVFLNASPIELWPGGGKLPASIASVGAAPVRVAAKSDRVVINPLEVAPASAQNVVSSAPTTARDASPEALKSIQKSYQATLDRMVEELNAQAHFVRYAPPAFIPFHQGVYLQFSLATSLADTAAGSQYKLAALAFDQHIAHLVRPALEYLKEEHGDFDGIDFATSVRAGIGENSENSLIAVEFILPLKGLRAYKQFDATGQQLIDSGFVLINGERVSLDLQSAEASAR